MNIEVYMQALELAKTMAEVRKQFNELVEIANEKHADEAIKFEAKELTKNGFYSYLAFMLKLSNLNNE